MDQIWHFANALQQVVTPETDDQLFQKSIVIWIKLSAPLKLNLKKNIQMYLNILIY